MSGCLDSEEWRRFLDRFQTKVAVVNMRSMFLHLDKASLVDTPDGRATRPPGTPESGEFRNYRFLFFIVA